MLITFNEDGLETLNQVNNDRKNPFPNNGLTIMAQKGSQTTPEFIFKFKQAFDVFKQNNPEVKITLKNISLDHLQILTPLITSTTTPTIPPNKMAINFLVDRTKAIPTQSSDTDRNKPRETLPQPPNFNH